MARVVVITGAAGGIGTQLRAHLEARGGYELRLLDIDPRGDPHIIQADLSLMDDRWIAQFEGADAVVHLAANPQPNATWDALIAPSVDAVLNVYLAAAHHKVGRVVLASSIWAMAARLADAGPIEAAAQPDPGANAYGASKLFAERVAYAMWRAHGVPTVALRIGGMREAADAIDVWGYGCWLSVRDGCQGLELAIRAPIEGVLVANLTSANAGSRWSLETTREALGFAPQDGVAASRNATRPPASHLIARLLKPRRSA
ncbi:NAD(P)-dependent oxidoreductase [Phenylobacterium sp.]|uniref:NAD-dependent epimerase/dehydratase family protein n=1 Tax=Phenylobacterium sp. TaxID=1871053 RepID=UPI00273709C3|nr:NAD(P)-dependent oxidoreductase [Phenylobacterium sp.]MDP3660984.1 NAD(P)-dependent oxidoreductase [Phenylobacterium sp.]